MQFKIPGGTEAIRYLRKIEKSSSKFGKFEYVKRSGSRIHSSRSRSGCRLSPCIVPRYHASYAHAVLPYGIQLYLGTRPGVVNIWHVCTHCVHCTQCVYIYTPAGTHTSSCSVTPKKRQIERLLACVHCLCVQLYTVCTLCTPAAVHHSNHADELRVFLNPRARLTVVLLSWVKQNKGLFAASSRRDHRKSKFGLCHCILLTEAIPPPYTIMATRPSMCTHTCTAVIRLTQTLTTNHIRRRIPGKMTDHFKLFDK
jgi:hypothetical protein